MKKGGSSLNLDLSLPQTPSWVLPLPLPPVARARTDGVRAAATRAFAFLATRL